MVHQKMVSLFQTFEDVSVGIFQRSHGKVREMLFTFLVGLAGSDPGKPQVSARICCEIQLHCEPTGFWDGVITSSSKLTWS